MGQTLFDRFAELLDDDHKLGNSHSEWVVDGQDPEEQSDYEFIFVEKISLMNNSLRFATMLLTWGNLVHESVVKQIMVILNS